MRVLHVISDENIGGAGVLLTSLLKNFERDQVESLVALPYGSALEPRIVSLGVRTCSLAHPPQRMNAPSFWELTALIRRERPQIVHANAALCARLAGRACGIPTVHTRHCCFPPTGIWKLGAVRNVGGRCNRALSDRVIATAEAAKENLLQFGIPAERITCIRNGSEPVRPLREAERLAIQQRWGLRASDFAVGICARLVPCKGHVTLLRAAQRLLQSPSSVRFRFLVVGEGPERTRLEAEAKALGISDSVIFTGFLEDMAQAYGVMRLNVNCSVGTETSCLAVSEGMSAGVPALVSDYGGNADMIGESLAGAVYPQGDDRALAEWIRKIAADPLLEQRMKQAARERYRQLYTAKGMADAVTRVYRDLLENKNAGKA